MSKKIPLSLSLLAVTLMTSSCATIISGKKEEVRLVSNQPYQVKIDNTVTNSPGSVVLKRSDEDKIIIVKCKNGENKQILKHKINPWFIGNIIFGGVFGSTTDYATGAMWKYDQTVKIKCSQE